MQDVLESEGGHCARCPSIYIQGAPRDPKRCRARFAFVCLLRDQGGRSTTPLPWALSLRTLDEPDIFGSEEVGHVLSFSA